MGYRSRSRSRSPAAARDGRSDRHRRRSPERRDDRPERGSPSYRPYRERDDRGPYENGARGAGHDWSYDWLLPTLQRSAAAQSAAAIALQGVRAQAAGGPPAGM